MTKKTFTDLPSPLTNLVSWSVAQLGEVLKSELGEQGFQRIEDIRMQMKSTRGASYKKVLSHLENLHSEFSELSDKKKWHIAHAFGLMLELINSCESAYRTYRLRQKNWPSTTSQVERIVFVLTAHPTEARSPQMLEIQQNILDVLLSSLEKPEEDFRDELRYWLHLAWHIPLAKQKKPTVADEAEMIYSIVLTPAIIEKLIAIRKKNIPVFIRTWVGGDKDGHPGVDERAMLSSLSGSRLKLLRFVQEDLAQSLKNVTLLREGAKTRGVDELAHQLIGLKSFSAQLKKISTSDGLRIREFNQKLRRIIKKYKQLAGYSCKFQTRIQHLLELFPALVIPLELREDSDVIHSAVHAPKDHAIGRMLIKLREISGGLPPNHYAKGLVISMTEDHLDILDGIKLTDKTLLRKDFPVIPLFENEVALSNGRGIIEELFKNKRVLQRARKDWSQIFEVMVGYSDSSKENGSLMSRYLIESALIKLEKVIQNYHLTPVFFHGSGGSVARGGGSIEEQTAWWPKSAVKAFKATIQGEMIYRSFSSPEILHSQIFKIQSESGGQQKTSLNSQQQNSLKRFAQAAQQAYRAKVSSPEFMEIVAYSTPYNYLQYLKIGSRPSKRKKELNLENLRAIPWILCWTQSRVLFPAWWGIGSHWLSLDEKEKDEVQQLFQESALFRSFIKLLGFTLSKVELGVWQYHLKHSPLDSKLTEETFKEVCKEYEASVQCVKQLAGESDLLWYRPWLTTSIAYRSPLIHPLNVLQQLALEKENGHLLRETVTGIASGMMTTG